MAELTLPRRGLSWLANSWAGRFILLVPWFALLGTLIGGALGGPSCIEGFGGNIGLEDTAGGGCVEYFRFFLLLSLPLLCPTAVAVVLGVAYVRREQEPVLAGPLAVRVTLALALCAWPAFALSWFGWMDTSGYGYSLWEVAHMRGLRLHECVEGREFLGYLAGCLAGALALAVAALAEGGRFPRR
ncbi:MAG: hypothetical protein FJX74_01735 [Armatimonadetes bacterium]|nr:hypothetical protein [Armatimonadota bacterium]